MPDLIEVKVNIKNEKIGSPISDQLSEYLRQYTSKGDRADVSIKTGVGASTIRDVVYRNNNLTEDNSRAIYRLINVAIHNGMNSIKETSIAVAHLKSIIKPE